MKEPKMKKYIRKSIGIAGLVLTGMLFGCSDDAVPELESELRNEGDVTISCFSLNKRAVRLPDSTVEGMVRLVSAEPEVKADSTQAVADTIFLPTRITVDKKKIRVEMQIPENVELDREYLLTIHRERGKRRYVGGVRASFKGNLLCEVGEEAPEYRGLEGEGTEESPYLIGSADDFLSFLNNLRRDEMFHGSEMCFRQTADFTAPTQSSILDGRGYYGFDFEGCYDGDNHSIDNLYYIGNKDSSKDAGIGLFPELSGSAEVKNLRLTNVNINRAFNNVGALCGEVITRECVKISNVKVSGTIMDCHQQVGGLIGTGSGSLIVDGCDLSVNVEGDSYCGGVIGKFDGNSLIVNNITTQNHRFSIRATGDYAGGVVGYLESDDELRLTNIKLEHTVSSEDADVRIISARSEAGGLAGYAFLSFMPEALFGNVQILCPVSVDDKYAGGIIGNGDINVGMRFSGCKVKSVVKGKSGVGGFFGKLNGYSDMGWVFEGGDGANCFEADLGAAGVTASDHGGGIFGYLYHCHKIMGNKVKVAANVDVSGECAGGVAGYVEYSDIDPSRFIINTSMRVKGDSKVGGFAGKSLYGSIVDSRNPVFDVEATPRAYIPAKSQFPSVLSCMVEGRDYVGGIVGHSESKLLCLASGATITSRGSYAGGVAGYAGIYDGYPIQRCVFMGSLGSSGTYTGGIAGFLTNSVSGKRAGGFLRDCVNYSAINGGSHTGGIAGMVDYSSGVRMELHRSVNLGRVSGGVPCGGLIGKCDGTGGVGMGMVGLANYGDVNSTGNDSGAGVGGIIGDAASTHIAINGAMNKGNIHAEGHVQGVAGVVGVLGHDPGGASFYQSHNGELYWSANYGKISCSNRETYIGGVCGWLEEGYSGGHDSYIHDCYNIGEVTTDHNSDTGGILGYVDHFGRSERCINFGKVSYGNAMIGTQKSACIFYHSNLNMINGTGKDWCADRKINSSDQGNTGKYKGISFDNTNWKMTSGRPHLASNRFEDVTPPQ